MFNYNFTNVTSFNSDLLDKELKESSLGLKVSGLSFTGSTIAVHCILELTAQEHLDLTDLLDSHTLNHASSFDHQMIVSKESQIANVNFGQALLNDWIRKNTLEGMSVYQSLWVFSRFEEFEVTTVFGTKKIDLFKVFQAGAIPTLYYCILQIQPDSMLETYHWVTQARIDWIKERVEEYLGAGTVGYIQGLD